MEIWIMPVSLSSLYAPTAATVATAVAAAVPTISAINSSVASNAPSPFSWTVITNTVANGSATSYTFSSLSGYRYYRLIFEVSLPASAFNVRLNGDGGNNYTRTFFGYSSGGVTGSFEQNQSFMLQASTNSGLMHGDLTIENATSTVYKIIKGTTSSNANFHINHFGIWRNTAAVTSILVFSDNNNITNGSRITLLGAN
jgi:hypothetical protein